MANHDPTRQLAVELFGKLSDEVTEFLNQQHVQPLRVGGQVADAKVAAGVALTLCMEIFVRRWPPALQATIEAEASAVLKEVVDLLKKQGG